jgi:hypothetical protein
MIITGKQPPAQVSCGCNASYASLAEARFKCPDSLSENGANKESVLS